MNKIEIEYQYLNGNHIVMTNQDKREQFFGELKDGEYYKLTAEKGIGFNSYLQMKYYRSGVLGSFVPFMFQLDKDAHVYFATEFLSQVDIIELTDPEKDKKIHDIMVDVSQSIVPVIETIKYLDDNNNLQFRLRFGWVKSTSVLGTRAFKAYIDDIIRVGADQGVEVKDSKLWKQENGY